MIIYDNDGYLRVAKPGELMLLKANWIALNYSQDWWLAAKREANQKLRCFVILSRISGAHHYMTDKGILYIRNVNVGSVRP